MPTLLTGREMDSGLVGFYIIVNSVFVLFVFFAKHFGAFMKERVRCFFIYSFGHLALVF
jgi:hypothetical protein